MKKLANLSMFESLMGTNKSAVSINSCFNAGGTKLTLTLLAALLPGLIAGCHRDPTLEERIMNDLRHCETVEEVEALRTHVLRTKSELAPDTLKNFDMADFRGYLDKREAERNEAARLAKEAGKK